MSMLAQGLTHRSRDPALRQQRLVGEPIWSRLTDSYMKTSQRKVRNSGPLDPPVYS